MSHGIAGRSCFPRGLGGCQEIGQPLSWGCMDSHRCLSMCVCFFSALYRSTFQHHHVHGRRYLLHKEGYTSCRSSHTQRLTTFLNSNSTFSGKLHQPIHPKAPPYQLRQAAGTHIIDMALKDEGPLLREEWLNRHPITCHVSSSFTV